MTDNRITDWDDAYANAAHIPGAENFPPKWANDAAAFRTSWTERELDIAYGDTERRSWICFFRTTPPKAWLCLYTAVFG